MGIMKDGIGFCRGKSAIICGTSTFILTRNDVLSTLIQRVPNIRVGGSKHVCRGNRFIRGLLLGNGSFFENGRRIVLRGLPSCAIGRIGVCSGCNGGDRFLNRGHRSSGACIVSIGLGGRCSVNLLTGLRNKTNAGSHCLNHLFTVHCASRSHVAFCKGIGGLGSGEGPNHSSS